MSEDLSNRIIHTVVFVYYECEDKSRTQSEKMDLTKTKPIPENAVKYSVSAYHCQ